MTSHEAKQRAKDIASDLSRSSNPDVQRLVERWRDDLAVLEEHAVAPPEYPRDPILSPDGMVTIYFDPAQALTEVAAMRRRSCK